VGLAHPGRPEEQHVLPIGDEAAARQLLDHLGIDRGLKLPVEALQRLLEGEARHADPHRQVLLVLRAQLEPQDLVEEVAVAQVLLGGLFQQRRELGLHPVQPEPLAVLAEPVELGGGHGAPPSTSAAEVAKSRTATSASTG
jgi:hypothetical protein